MCQIPQSLKKDNGYDHRNALFGMLPYGGSIQQSVYYTSDNLCAGSEDIGDNLKPTSRSPDDGPFILMVDRGECTFVTKVRNAQHYGAAAVLIADDKCMYKQQQQQRQTTCSFIRREPNMSHNSRLFRSSCFHCTFLPYFLVFLLSSSHSTISVQ